LLIHLVCITKISEADIHFLIGNGIVVAFMKVVAEHFIMQALTKKTHLINKKQ